MGPDSFRQGSEEERGGNREEEQGRGSREKEQEGWSREKKDQGGRSQEQQALTLCLFGVWAFPQR